MFHCFRHLVTVGGPHIGCRLHHRAPALGPRRLRPTHVHRRRAVSSRTLIQINILDRRLATAFLYSPQLRKSPMSPGIPPGNSRTRAASRKPCGLRSRSHRRYMSDASPRNVAGQLGEPALTARPASPHSWLGKRSSKNSFSPRSAAWRAQCIRVCQFSSEMCWSISCMTFRRRCFAAARRCSSRCSASCRS